jgi:hypothetical protein
VIDHPVASWFFALENLTICAGYLFVAVAVAPLFLRKVGVRSWATKLGGVGFFLLCGLTHLQMALKALFSPAGHESMVTHWWMHAIHGPQAIAVWVFVVGLYIELTDVNWTLREPRVPLQRPPTD